MNGTNDGNLHSKQSKNKDVHEPVYITSRRNKAVIISEEDFKAMQETLYLLSIPGMRESILKGRKESTGECSDQLDW